MCTAKPYAKASPDTLKGFYFGWIECGCELCKARVYLEEKRLRSFGHDVYQGAHRGVPADQWWRFDGYRSFDHPALVVSNHIRALRSLEGLSPYGNSALDLLKAREQSPMCAKVQRATKRRLKQEAASRR